MTRFLLFNAILAAGLAGCTSPTESSSAPNGCDSFFTICSQIGGPTLPGPGPVVARISGSVLTGDSLTTWQHASHGPLYWRAISPDTSSWSWARPVLGHPWPGLDAGQFRIELDSATVAAGGCHGLVRFYWPEVGLETEIDALVDSATVCQGEVTGRDIRFPALVPVRLAGSITTGGTPVSTDIALVFSSPNSDYAGDEIQVMQGATLPDGTFHLEGQVPENRCGRLLLRQTPSGRETQVPGCGSHTIHVTS